MATRPTEALTVIPQYNLDPYDEATNPYGFDDGGHIYNHLQSFRYVVQIENWLHFLSGGVASAALQTADDRRQTGEDRVQTGLDRQAAATFDPALYARKDGAQFTGDVEVRGAGNRLRYHIPGVYQGFLELQGDGRLVWFVGENTPALTIFPDGDLFFHGANLRLSEQMAACLRVDAEQAFSGDQQALGLANLGVSPFLRSIRAAADSAAFRAAIQTDVTRQVIQVSGGNEQDGLAAALTTRLSFDFIARASTALFNGSCSVRASTNEFHFAYLHLRVADLAAGGYAGGTSEQVVSMGAGATGHFYSLSRSLALSNLVIGRTYRVELCPRVDANNAGTPQGMTISGVN